MKTILFQGDSITDAGRSREDFSDLGRGYATLIKSELGFEEPGAYDFLNRGVSGNRVVDLYARIKSDIINLKPDVMSILIGVNDVWHELGGRHNGVDAEKYEKIYTMLLDEVQAALPDVKIMILEPFVLKASATEGEWECFRREVYKRAEKAQAVARRHHLTFIPLQEKFLEAEKQCPAEYWLRDGVHPTNMGHELIKREWIRYFNQIKEIPCFHCK